MIEPNPIFTELCTYELFDIKDGSLNLFFLNNVKVLILSLLLPNPIKTVDFVLAFL